MVNKALWVPEERSRVYWFLSDCFLQAPTEISSEIWQALQLSANNSEPMELRKEFTRLFRGIRDGYGPPPPYESLYRPDIFPTDITEAILGYFHSGGLDAAKICGEPPDFLATELRLLSLLAYQEHESSQNGNLEQCQFFSDLQTRFVQNHLLCWVPDYCQILIQESRVDFYSQLATHIATFLNEIQNKTWTGKIS